MNYGKMALVILLLCMAPGLYAQHKKTLYPNLAGKWVSKDDPNYTLLVKNGWIYESYKDTPEVDTFKYEITNRSCFPGKWNDKKNLFLRKKEKADGDEYCYKLLSYSSNAFVMISDGNGTTYHFIRYLKRY